MFEYLIKLSSKSDFVLPEWGTLMILPSGNRTHHHRVYRKDVAQRHNSHDNQLTLIYSYIHSHWGTTTYKKMSLYTLTNFLAILQEAYHETFVIQRSYFVLILKISVLTSILFKYFAQTKEWKWRNLSIGTIKNGLAYILSTQRIAFSEIPEPILTQYKQKDTPFINASKIVFNMNSYCFITKSYVCYKNVTLSMNETYLGEVLLYEEIT